MRDLLEYRSEFPILAHTTYLTNHSLAAMPRRAEEIVEAGAFERHLGAVARR